MGWSQPELAKKLGTSQNAISRLEKPDYGKASLTTLKKLAAIYDVGLIVRFAPFSQLADWESNTPYTEYGLIPEAMNPATFDEEESSGALERDAAMNAHMEWATSETPRGNELRTTETPMPGLLPSIKYFPKEEQSPTFRRTTQRRPRKVLTSAYGKRRTVAKSAA